MTNVTDAAWALQRAQMREARPFAAQTWRNGMFDGSEPRTVLQILVRDICDDIDRVGVTSGPVEIWYHERQGRKGIFAGDTSSLANEGWTRLAAL